MTMASTSSMNRRLRCPNIIDPTESESSVGSPMCIFIWELRETCSTQIISRKDVILSAAFYVNSTLILYSLINVEWDASHLKDNAYFNSIKTSGGTQVNCQFITIKTYMHYALSILSLMYDICQNHHLSL